MKAKINVKALKLLSGSHKSVAEGACVMELASYLAREKWSDRPACVSPALGAFLRSWNDSLNDEDRQKLKPYAKKSLNTRSDNATESKLAWMATDWLARECAPAWLRCAGLTDHAHALESIVSLMDDATAGAAQPALSAADSAARSAAHSAARSAARSAALSAAYSAALSAARSAARSAAYSAAYSAALSAAHSAALSAARSAAYSAAYSAADSAADSALEPTVKILQASAFKLLDRMIAVAKASAK